MNGRSVASLVLTTASMALVVVAFGCTEEEEAAPAGPPVGMPGPKAAGGGPRGGGMQSPLKQAMMRIGRGPDSLTNALGKALEASNPDWTTIQSQAKEYAQLAGTLGASKPSRGDEASWAKMTAAFLATAQTLEKAATAKDKAAASAAQKQLASSCKECHDAHRGRGGNRGMGGPGMGGPGGPPPGGPPPGGFGPPPGGPSPATPGALPPNGPSQATPQPGSTLPSAKSPA